MDNFRKQLKKSIKIYRVVIIAAIILWLGLNISVKLNGKSRATDSSDGFCASVIVIMAINIAQYSAALKNDEKLKKLYIRETDERTRLIYEKTNSSSFMTAIIVLGLSAMVASFYSETVFYTLVAVIIVIAFIQAGFSFYYRRKF